MEDLYKSGHNADEWEEWMDWDKTIDSNTSEQARTPTCRTSSDRTCHLPSPETSTTSELPSNSSRKRNKPSDSQEPKGSSKQQTRGSTLTQNKSHSIVEKRYRANLNHKIAELGKCLPSLQGESKNDGYDKEDSRESTTALKHGKATVLTEAIAYIKHLEQRNGYLEQANTALREQSRDWMSTEVPIQEDIKTGASTNPQEGNSSPAPSPSGSDDTASSKSIEGMISVPEEWKRMWRGELRSYTSGQVEPDANQTNDKGTTNKIKVRGGKYAGRVIVGSLAGLMVVDGFAATQKEKPDDRGLFSIPLLRHIPVLPDIRSHVRPQILWNEMMSPHHSPILPSLLKGFLLFGFLGLMLFIYLFNSKPPSRKGTSTPAPHPAPSLVSPLEVRQRAFLTAIRTIWVPRHHVLPEMLALNIETAAYIIRQLLGWHVYSWLTGRSEEEEIARVRAWDIAIDAQLSGGDPEISKSRLVLSLWASGTLPSSPARLMLKALHIRILFWQPSNLPWLTELLHKVARKLARWQWNKAYNQQRKLEALGSQSDTEVLTDHLKALLQRSSDEVMTDAMIQRAHNLAWNTSNSDREPIERAVEDTAMRGPLDGLASWFSGVTLSTALTAALQSDEITKDSSFLRMVDIAELSAPPGSFAEARALITKAIFCCNAEGIAHVNRLLRHMKPSPFKARKLPTEKPPDLLAPLSELPVTDDPNMEVCLKCVELIWNEQQLQRSRNERSCDISKLTNGFGGRISLLGLHGWAAICQTVLVARNGHSVELLQSFKASVSGLIEGLDNSKALDASIRERVASLLKRTLIHEDTKRRHSGASDDTGYASMSDENGNCGVG